MIKLTRETGDSIFLAAEMVCSVVPLQDGKLSLVSTQEDVYKVTETPEQVVRKIMEYKLAMVRYKSASDVFESAETGSEKIGEAAEGKADAKNILKHLAGLEDSRDA